MAEHVLIEFLFGSEPVCVLSVNMYYGYSFCLDLKPMNGGWMGFSCISVKKKKKMQWVSVLIFLLFFPLCFDFCYCLACCCYLLSNFRRVFFFFFDINGKFYCLVKSFTKNPYDIFLFLS